MPIETELIIQWEKSIANGSNADCKIPLNYVQGLTVTSITLETNVTMTYLASFIDTLPDTDDLTINGTQKIENLKAKWGNDQNINFANSSGGVGKAKVIVTVRRIKGL